jgi:hypothetical protein
MRAPEWGMMMRWLIAVRIPVLLAITAAVGDGWPPFL